MAVPIAGGAISTLGLLRRNKLAMLAAKAAAARTLTYSCVQMIEQGQDTVREVSMLKAYACETLQEVVHGCLQLTGGAGYITGTPIERQRSSNHAAVTASVA